MTQIYLIGAGPGDAELITLKAIKILKMADVILYDHLIHPNHLLFAKPTCEKVYVGKQKGRHSQTQTDILALIKKYAEEKKTIARLKGGDPMVFGRAGEEIDYIKSLNLSYEIIPGISSAISVPTFSGIPLTHRQHSKSVAFVTGTTKTGHSIQADDLPMADTLVILMAQTQKENLQTHLLVHPKFNKETPVALISNGGKSNQITCHSVLKKLHELPELPAPALLVVGEVASYASNDSWLTQRPLHGQRVILLRQLSQVESLSEQLSLLGADVICHPIIQTVARPHTLPDLSTITRLIFTSANAVHFFMQSLLTSNRDVRSLSQIKITSIGPKTSEKCREYGLIPDNEARTYSSEGILDSLPNLDGEQVLLPQSKQAGTTLKEGLREKGATVQIVHTYDTQAETPPPITLADTDTLFFTSGTTVNYFFDHYPSVPKDITAISISESLTQLLKQHGLKNIITSQKATQEAMVEAMLKNCPKRV